MKFYVLSRRDHRTRINKESGSGFSWTAWRTEGWKGKGREADTRKAQRDSTESGGEEVGKGVTFNQVGAVLSFGHPTPFLLILTRILPSLILRL